MNNNLIVQWSAWPTASCTVQQQHRQYHWYTQGTAGMSVMRKNEGILLICSMPDPSRASCQDPEEPWLQQRIIPYAVQHNRCLKRLAGWLSPDTTDSVSQCRCLCWLLKPSKGQVGLVKSRYAILTYQA